MTTDTRDPLETEPRQAQPGEPPPEVKRDRWGRYLLPNPESGKLQAWTRATTFAKSASDTFALAQWQNRMVAKGMSMRPDLYALAASAHPDDKDTLNQIAERAKEAAGGSAASSLGTALHAFTEQQDRGEKPIVPEPWTDNVTIYTKCLAQHQLKVNPDFIETVVIVPKFGVAGTLDRLGTLPGAKYLRVVDLKTGKDLSYGWMEIAVQLFLYSQATHWYDVATETLHEMPPVDHKIGNVIHLPVNQKIAALYEVDLEMGAAVARLITPIREFRKRKDFSKLVSPPIEAIDPATVAATVAETITAPADPEWDDPQPQQAESAKITESVRDGNARDAAAKGGERWSARKEGSHWIVVDLMTGEPAMDGDEVRTWKLKRDTKAWIIGQQAAVEVAEIREAERKADEWPEDAETTAPEPAATKAPADPWMPLIFVANSYEELQDYFRRGHAAGTWNDHHTKAAARRVAELKEIEREIANAPTDDKQPSDELPDDDNW